MHVRSCTCTCNEKAVLWLLALLGVPIRQGLVVQLVAVDEAEVVVHFIWLAVLGDDVGLGLGTTVGPADGALVGDGVVVGRWRREAAGKEPSVLLRESSPRAGGSSKWLVHVGARIGGVPPLPVGAAARSVRSRGVASPASV